MQELKLARNVHVFILLHASPAYPAAMEFTGYRSFKQSRNVRLGVDVTGRREREREFPPEQLSRIGVL